MDGIFELYMEYNIFYVTENHKHTRPGWVNIECPFCTGNPGYHLGFNLHSNSYTCWRCGYHHILPTISALVGVSFTRAAELIKQFEITSKPFTEIEITPHGTEPFLLPSGVTPLSESVYHVRYLEKRKFEPLKLEQEWGLMATGAVSFLGHSRYDRRIVIPYIWNNKQVSFDCRDITDKSKEKYKACPKNREIIPHKNILYGDQSEWMDTGILVEGTTDVWRLGKLAAATSGIKYTREQVKEIRKWFKNSFVIFDGGDIQAQKQAKKLVSELLFFGVNAERVSIKGDPGEMPQKKADQLVNQLMKHS